ncbi:MAG TPA: transglutaminase domain-containing protein [Flavobacteriales bacterium]|nr:transglutaminase domain-containing protein [Flavobacteriales bacterium]
MKFTWLTNRQEAENRSNALASIVLTALIAVVLSFPVYVFFYRFMPPMFMGDVRIDTYLTFIPVYVVVLYLALKIRPWLIYAILAGSCILLITGAVGVYGFRDLYEDYKIVVYNLREGLKATYFKKEGEESFINAERFREAIDYTNPTVREFAVNVAVKHFDAYSNTTYNRKTIQFFSIFKEIRTKWRYVFDPSENEFYAKASETIRLLKADDKFKGDCDDYSIFTAACIKAVGGRVRLVRTRIVTPEKTTGHVYPEVMIGNIKDLENINYLVHEVLFARENQGKPIYFCKDADGSVWLNFDYSDFYPGGPYVSRLRIATIEI